MRWGTVELDGVQRRRMVLRGGVFLTESSSWMTEEEDGGPSSSDGGQRGRWRTSVLLLWRREEGDGEQLRKMEGIRREMEDRGGRWRADVQDGSQRSVLFLCHRRSYGEQMRRMEDL